MNSSSPALPRTPSAWLLLIAVSLPLLWPLDPGVIAKMGTTLLACGLWGAVLLLAAWEGLVPRPGWASAALAAMAAVVAVQTATGLIAYPSQGLITVAVLLAAALLAGLGRAAAARATARSPRSEWLDAVALGLLLQALVQVAFGLLQFALWQSQGLQQALAKAFPLYTEFVSYPFTGRVFGNLRQPNHYATAVALGMAGLAWWAPRLRPAGVWTISAAFAWALVVCGSRTGAVEAFAGAVLIAIFVRGAWRQPRWAALLAMPLLYAGWWVVMRTLDHYGLVSFLDAVTRQVDQPVNARALIWRNAWQVFEHLPWTGAGWGQLGWGMQHAALHGALHPLPLDNIDNAHDLFLELLAENGVLGALPPLLLALAWLWVSLRRAIALGRSDGARTPAALAGWMGMTMLGLHSLVEYPLWYLYFLAIFAVLAGWIEGVGVAPAAAAPTPRSRWAAIVAGVVVLALSAKALVDYVATNAVYDGNAGGALQAAQRSNWFFRPLVDFAQASALAVSANDSRARLQADLALIDRVSHVYGDPSLLMRRMVLLVRLGDAPQALRLARYTASAFWLMAPQLAQQFPPLARAAGLSAEQIRPLEAALRAAPVLRRLVVPQHDRGG